ncbi:MAG: crotonase/enoyl-CoA hydratase family protein [Deltaproteobacteria bacterium]|jgi:enoyl-CoA hydratase|nr:crotonase/enoyl-CoA hydratase family protein [Deltaproteobacteria bacterium]
MISTESVEVGPLRVQKEGHVTWVFLARPESRNAMGPDLWEALPKVFGDIDRDDSCRVAVLAAEGKHFTVGLDLKSVGSLVSFEGTQAQQRRALHQEILRLQESVTAIERVRKPVIAAIHGYCIGGGIDVITACDMRVAAKDAIFSVRETRMAIVADLGTLQRLPGIVGRGHASELVYTGKDIDAERAREIGLVNHVYADREAALEGAQELADEIASLSPLAVQGSKQVMASARRAEIAEGLRYVALWNSAFLVSDDLGEALASFMEKRKPDFKGG